MTPAEIERYKAEFAAALDEASKFGLVEMFRVNANHWGNMEEAFTMVDGFVTGEIDGNDPEWGETGEDYEQNLIVLAGLALVMVAEIRAEKKAKNERSKKAD